MQKIIKVTLRFFFILFSFLFTGFLFSALIYLCEQIKTGPAADDEWWGLVWMYTFPFGGVMGIILAAAYLLRNDSWLARTTCLFWGGGLTLAELYWLSGAYQSGYLMGYAHFALPLLWPPIIVVAGLIGFKDKEAEIASHEK